jgi:deoxyribonuclease-1-like protein
MSVKPILFVLFVLLAAGGTYVGLNYRLETGYEDGRLTYVKLVPRKGPAVETPGAAGGAAAGDPVRAGLRIATLDLGRFDEQKASDRRVGDVLVRVIPGFQIVALQGLRDHNRSALVRLVEQLNAAGGRRYDFAAGPTTGLTGERPYSAFVFDQAAVEIDRSRVHTVDDPDGHFHSLPLVGMFRARGPRPAEAFTFRIISVQTDPDRVVEQLELLDDVFRAVRDDGLGEDDVLLVGELGADEEHLGPLGRMLDVTAAVTATPTNVRGTARTSNILFDRRATCEFTGRAGVTDVLRDLGLTVEGALEVSENLPVWAEFDAFEGGNPGFVQARIPAATR